MSDPSGKQRVLVAPMPWGLGHATRCIPIIRRQLAEGHEVIIAASGGPKALLLSHFPSLQTVDIPFMTITYPADGRMVKHFFWQGPRLIWSIVREHRKLQVLVKELGIDLVISDSRFGLWTKRCRSVFITHQVRIKTPVFEGLVNSLNRWVMNRYDEVWIPDHETKPGLAGELSHPTRMPSRYRYVGPLSRFEEALNRSSETIWDAVAIISGPEPQRSLFEAEVIRRYVESGERLLLLEGKPDEPKETEMDNILIVHHLDDRALTEALATTRKVIARSGYSTIMDMAALGVQDVEYHPTPGQTEQEYLAQLHGGQS